MRIRTTTHIGIAIAILVIGLFDTTAVEAASITAPTDYVIPQGTVGSVPILLNETRDVVSGMLQLDYDPTQYRVSGVTTADATED